MPLALYHTRRRRPYAAFVFALAFAGPLPANTYTVTNTNDSGPNSLRQAILDANSNAGADTIVFSIGSGAQTITPLSQLPAATGPVTFDGWQQMGFAGVPLIRIDGISAGAGSTGLQLAAGPSTIQGLIITRFGGVGLYVTGGSGNVVKGCYIGSDGTTALGNGYSGLNIDGANFSTVGGPLAKDINVISGNGQNGVFLGSTSSDIAFYNNRIGTNAAGTAAIANSGYGMRIFAPNTVIGNALAITRNIISGNASNGIGIETFVSNTQILGAYVGLNAAGTAAIPNGGDGIGDGGSESLIGNVTPGGGNVISGNAGNGISLDADGSQLVNNLIGTDPTGTSAIPNQQYGIRALTSGFVNIGVSGTNGGNVISGNGNHGVVLESTSTVYSLLGNKIGTTLAGDAALPNAGDGVVVSGQSVIVGSATAGNLISGNSGNGISIQGAAQDVTIVNNTIGLNAAGMAKLANSQYGIRAITSGTGLVIGQANNGNLISGNARGVILEAVDGAAVQGNTIGLSGDQSTALGNGEFGLQIEGSGNQIGGTTAGAGNVIAGNALYALFLYGPGATGNHVEGNVIGTNAALTGNFPNFFDIILYGASGNFIGGTAAGAGNVISNSANIGIYDWFGSQNRFLGNRIYGNGGLGIDLQPQGPVPNDPLDADHGPNEGQNYPVVTLATATPTTVSLQGHLDSLPMTGFRIEYFVSVMCDPSGLGEGDNFIGFQNVTTDANGGATLGTTIPTALVEGYVTATATSSDGNTSEFSPCIAIGPASAGEFNIGGNPVLAYEDFQVAHVAVVRSQGLGGAASVHVKTIDGSATSPADYGTIDQVLNFADGESVKMVDVPIVLDNTVEPTKQFTIALSQATGGAFLGAQSSATVDLFDHDPAYPFYLAGDATTPEPLSGQVQVNVPVRLSAATGHTITIGYVTQDGSAIAGQDYIAASGQVVFAAGEVVKYVPLTVKANGVQPSDRVFYLVINGAGQQVIAGDSEGEIVIFGGDRIFRNGFG
jgi:hypothetical protein